MTPNWSTAETVTLKAIPAVVVVVEATTDSRGVLLSANVPLLPA